MTTVELIEEIQKRSHLKKAEITTVLSLLLEEMKKSLSGGEPVKLRGFGTLYVKRLKPRVLFGGKRKVAARNVVKIHPSRRLRWISSASSSKKKQ